MAMSEDHASCWVHKELTVTAKHIQAWWTAARASGGKDKCQVRLTGIKQEYWMGTEIRAQSHWVMDLTKKGEHGSRVCEPAETKEKAAEEGGTQRGMI